MEDLSNKSVPELVKGLSEIFARKCRELNPSIDQKKMQVKLFRRAFDSLLFKQPDTPCDPDYDELLIYLKYALYFKHGFTNEAMMLEQQLVRCFTRLESLNYPNLESVLKFVLYMGLLSERVDPDEVYNPPETSVFPGSSDPRSKPFSRLLSESRSETTLVTKTPPTQSDVAVQVTHRDDQPNASELQILLSAVDNVLCPEKCVSSEQLISCVKQLMTGIVSKCFRQVNDEFQLNQGIHTNQLSHAALLRCTRNVCLAGSAFDSLHRSVFDNTAEPFSISSLSRYLQNYATGVIFSPRELDFPPFFMLMNHQSLQIRQIKSYIDQTENGAQLVKNALRGVLESSRYSRKVCLQFLDEICNIYFTMIDMWIFRGVCNPKFFVERRTTEDEIFDRESFINAFVLKKQELPCFLIAEDILQCGRNVFLLSLIAEDEFSSLLERYEEKPELRVALNERDLNSLLTKWARFFESYEDRSEPEFEETEVFDRQEIDKIRKESSIGIKMNMETEGKIRQYSKRMERQRLAEDLPRSNQVIRAKEVEDEILEMTAVLEAKIKEVRDSESQELLRLDIIDRHSKETQTIEKQQARNEWKLKRNKKDHERGRALKRVEKSVQCDVVESMPQTKGNPESATVLERFTESEEDEDDCFESAYETMSDTAVPGCGMPLKRVTRSVQDKDDSETFAVEPPDLSASESNDDLGSGMPLKRVTRSVRDKDDYEKSAPQEDEQIETELPCSERFPIASSIETSPPPRIEHHDDSHQSVGDPDLHSSEKKTDPPLVDNREESNQSGEVTLEIASPTIEHHDDSHQSVGDPDLHSSKIKTDPPLVDNRGESSQSGEGTLEIASPTIEHHDDSHQSVGDPDLHSSEIKTDPPLVDNRKESSQSGEGTLEIARPRRNFFRVPPLMGSFPFGSAPNVPTVDEDSDHLTSPSEIISSLFLSVTVPLMNQSDYIKWKLMDVFFKNFHIYDDFKAIREHFFLGLFCHNFTDSVYSLMKEKIDLRKFLRGLHMIVEKTACPRLSFRYESTDPDSNEELDLKKIKLTYITDWPINLILTQACINKYTLIFDMCWLLKRATWHLNDCRKRFCMRPSFKGNELTQVNIHLHGLRKFSVALISYLSIVFDNAWASFTTELKAAKSLDRLCELHVKFIKEIIFSALLNKKASQLASEINKALDTVFRYCRIVRHESEWIPVEGVSGEYRNTKFQKLCKLYAAFQKQVLYILTFVEKATKRAGYQQLVFLRELLSE